MAVLTVPEILRWDAKTIEDVFTIARSRAGTLTDIDGSMRQIRNTLKTWTGDSGEAFHQEIGKIREGMDADTVESESISRAIARVEADINGLQDTLRKQLRDADRKNLDVDDSGACSIKQGHPVNPESIGTLLAMQQEITNTMVRAMDVDDEIAAAIRSITAPQTKKQVATMTSGDGTVPATGISAAKAIDPSQVDFRGSGAWDSGEPAVRAYIGQALDSMGITDPKARANWTAGMLTLVQRESGMNAKGSQINLSDSNASSSTGTAADGHPNKASRGAAQCIPTTFAAYHQPGTSTSIYDPVANIAASMNYSMNRYGVSRDGSDLQSKIPQANAGASPQGY